MIVRGPGADRVPSLQVSLLIPARNEQHNLPHVLSRIPPWLHEVVLVDGRSDDDTIEVAKRCLPSIRVVNQTGSGKGDALLEGFAHCTGDAVVAMDADGSMDPGEIATFVAALESGAHYVKGSRMIGGSEDLTIFRRFGNWAFRSLARLLFGCRYTDLCYGYFAFMRGTVDRLDLRSTGFEIETEIGIKAHAAGLNITEVPSFESHRINGHSQLNTFRDGWRILRHLLSSRIRGVRREPAPPERYADIRDPVPVLRPVHGQVMTKELTYSGIAPEED